MKKLFLIAILGTMIFACKTETNTPIDGYRVIGEAPGIYNGIRVYLNSVDVNGRPIAKDTAIVMNERFKFEGDMEKPEMVILSVNSVNGNFPFVLEQKELNLKVNKDALDQSEISGTKANDALMEYHNTIKTITESSAKLRDQYNIAINPEDKKTVSKKIVENNLKKEDYPFTFLNANNDNYFSVILADNLLKERKKDVSRIAESFNGFSEDIKSSDLGKTVQEKIAAAKIEVAALNATEIGQKAPSFSAPSTDGKMIALNDIMGKVTIVDFWAAWCGPCRRENPNVVQVYEKYHDKGLEIISVSLDGNRRQQDPKAAWLQAIEDDKLNWHHVSNLNYFNDPVAKAYNIKSIPATFILDEKGNILAKNLRGNNLENKIAELLN